MSDFFLGEIRAFSFDWAPSGWALCNGASMPVQQTAALFALLGTTFGGDGKTNFLLPDLRGRAPAHPGLNGITKQGAIGGAETVTLDVHTMPPHTHQVKASNAAATSTSGANNLLAVAQPVSGETTPRPIYGPPISNLTPLYPDLVSQMGGSAGHDNMQPFAVVNFCIAINGIFPPRN